MKNKNYSYLLFADLTEIIELSAGVFRKQIVKFGRYADPRDRTKSMVLDRKWAREIIANFTSKVLDSVPVQITHKEHPNNNVGNVIGLEMSADGSGLDMLCSITEENASKRLAEKDATGNSIWRGVSVGFDPEYEETGQNKNLGNVLRHVAIVTHGFLKGMSDWESVTLGEEDNKQQIPMIYRRDTVKDRELVAALKERGYNVTSLADLQAKLADNESDEDEEENDTKDEKKVNNGDNAEVTKLLRQLLGNKNLQLSDTSEIAKGIKNLSTTVATLGEKVKKSEDRADAAEKRADLSDAASVIGPMLADGRIVPAKKDTFTKLFLSDRETFDTLTADLKPTVEFGEQAKSGPGVTPGSGVLSLTDDKVQGEIDRLANLANTMNATTVAGLTKNK